MQGTRVLDNIRHFIRARRTGKRPLKGLRHRPPSSLSSVPTSLPKMFLRAYFLLGFVALGIAILPNAPLPLPQRVSAPSTKSPMTKSSTGASLPPLGTVYYFDQLIDHNDPSKGTFRQRYWNSWEFYQPGMTLLYLIPLMSPTYPTNKVDPSSCSLPANRMRKVRRAPSASPIYSF